MDRRMETHDKRTCDKCGYSTSKASQLIRHKLVHGEKPYSCTRCDYSCSTAGNLKTHSYTHTGEKPFQCGSCDYSCTTADALKKHSYTHTGEKPYQCSSCAHCPPQTILEKRGALQNIFWATFGMRFCSSNSLLKLKNNALFTRLNLFLWFFHVVFLVILQISTCKNVATKHTIPQNTEIFVFLDSKY